MFEHQKTAEAPEHLEISRQEEWLRCGESPIYFINHHVQILSSEEEKWIPFKLWPAQKQVINMMATERRVILLKARQLGFTTMALCYGLWRFVFYPVATIGLFSRGEIEAKELLDRFGDYYDHLPGWMHTYKKEVDNAHHLKISSGSWARALSPKKGESFTFKVLFIDELDRYEDGETLIKNVKPAADAGKAQIIVGSISDKEKQKTVFKSMFRDARRDRNDWVPIFMPWQTRPERDKEWYDQIVADAVSRHYGDVAGAMDEVYQQYPNSVMEALSPRMQGKRIPYLWLNRVYIEKGGIENTALPHITGLKIYEYPQAVARCENEHETVGPVSTEDWGKCLECGEELGGDVVPVKYVMGADPAEGVDGGSDSSLCVLNARTGNQAAALQEKLEPKKVFPSVLFTVALYFNKAAVLVERNNHGHAVLGELAELIARASDLADGGIQVDILMDPADLKEGWLTSPSGTGMTRGKVAMYNNGAEHIATESGQIYDEVTLDELSSIDINKLKNIDGQDDASDAYVLAVTALVIPGRTIDGSPFL